MSKKWLIVAVVVVLVAVLGFAGYQRISARRAVAETPAEETAVVRRGTLLVTVGATGSLAPHAEVSLAFTSGGRVAEVLVEEGQVVEAGQPLARLETDDLTLQVAQAEAALAAAEAQLAQLLAPPRPEEIAVQEANLQAMQAQVSAAAANRDQLTAGADAAQIAAAEAQVASAQAQQKIALDAHDQTMKCRTVTQPDGTKKEMCPALGTREEEARYNLHAADVALAAAQVQLDALLAGADDQVRAAEANVWAAAAQRDAAQAQLDLLSAGSTEEQIQAAQAAVDQARVSLDQARLRLEQATLTAPMSGAVTALNVQPGEMVGTAQPAVVLSDLAALEVEVNLDETDVAQVAVGQKVQVGLDAFPGVEMAGEVAHIAPVAQAQAGVVLYPVTIRLVPAGTASPVPVRANKIFSGRNGLGELIVTTVNVAATSEDRAEAATGQIEALLLRRHGFGPDEEGDFSVVNQADLLAMVTQVTNILTVFLGAIAAISLLVGGIGIMNIMLVSVTERTREIGIRKAVGARKVDILTQFLLEAVVLSLLGGLIGILLGVGIARLVDTAGVMNAVISLNSVLLAVGFSLSVGLFFGIYPANRAAGLNPIEALRYE